MKQKNYLIFGIIAILGIVLISGCVQTGGPPLSTSPEMLGEQLNVYGRLLEYTKENDVVTLRIQQEIRNCELNKSVIIIEANTSRFQDSLITDNEYFFAFYRLPKGIWQLTQVSNMFDAKSCSHTHEYDLLLSFVQKTTEPSQCPEDEPDCMTAVKLIPLVITEGESATIQIKLTNKQDNILGYEISSSLLKFDPLHITGGPTYNGIPTNNCVATGLNSEEAIDPNSIRYLDIIISCDNILSDLDFNETFADYFITSTLRFTDELGNEHERTTDAFNTFSFAVRPKARCDAPDGKNYVHYEDLPIGKLGWREEIHYFLVNGFVLDPEEVTFTQIEENQVVLVVDNPAASALNPKITFMETKPEINKRVQIYGILDNGEFAAYKWCYVE